MKIDTESFVRKFFSFPFTGYDRIRMKFKGIVGKIRYATQQT